MQYRTCILVHIKNKVLSRFSQENVDHKTYIFKNYTKLISITQFFNEYYLIGNTNWKGQVKRRTLTGHHD